MSANDRRGGEPPVDRRALRPALRLARDAADPLELRRRLRPLFPALSRRLLDGRIGPLVRAAGGPEALLARWSEEVLEKLCLAAARPAQRRGIVRTLRRQWLAIVRWEVLDPQADLLRVHLRGRSRAVLGTLDLEEVVEETLQRALAHASDYDPTRPLERWLRAIGERRLSTRVARSRGREARLRDVAARLAAFETAWTDPLDALAAGEPVERIYGAVRRLPRSQRRLLRARLRAIPYAALVRAWGGSESALHNVMSRARVRLRAELEGGAA